jgi:ribosomal protein S12 methylthiotransferase accessory factor
VVRFSSARDCATRSFDGDVATLTSALRSAGVKRAVLVDLSQSDVGIPVVKVVVPGLAFKVGASYRARLDAGRASVRGPS